MPARAAAVASAVSARYPRSAISPASGRRNERRAAAVPEGPAAAGATDTSG